MINISQIPVYKQKHNKWITHNFDIIGLGNPKRVGNIMDFLSKRNPNTILEFWEKWTRYKKNRERFENVVYDIQRAKSCNTVTAYEIAFIGIIYNSYMGFCAERAASEYILKKFPNSEVRKTDKQFDNKYAVDLLAYDPEDDTYAGIQVKSNKSKNTNNTKFVERNLKKNKLFEKKYKCPVIYLYYEAYYTPYKQTFNIYFNGDRPTWAEKKEELVTEFLSSNKIVALK